MDVYGILRDYTPNPRKWNDIVRSAWRHAVRDRNDLAYRKVVTHMNRSMVGNAAIVR